MPGHHFSRLNGPFVLRSCKLALRLARRSICAHILGAVTFTSTARRKGNIMYIAMNRFKIALGHEDDFENLWRNRDSKLKDVPGFREFNLLKGPTDETSTLYASHTIWNSESEFVDWTQSDAFRQAHARSRAPEGTYLGPPQFEGFETVV